MTYSKWISTSLTTRMKIAEIFGIKKVRSTHVANNEVVDDGFNVKDIEAHLTVESIQIFLHNSIPDLDTLFNLLVDTLEGKMPEVTIVPDIYAVPVEEVKLKTNANRNLQKNKKRVE